MAAEFKIYKISKEILIKVGIIAVPSSGGTDPEKLFLLYLSKHLSGSTW